MTDQPNDGGGAFPVFMPAVPIGSPARVQPGMTLRDYFAAKALIGLIAEPGDAHIAELAADAYRFADAMLAERAKRRGA